VKTQEEGNEKFEKRNSLLPLWELKKKMEVKKLRERELARGIELMQEKQIQSL